MPSTPGVPDYIDWGQYQTQNEDAARQQTEGVTAQALKDAQATDPAMTAQQQGQKVSDIFGGEPVPYTPGAGAQKFSNQWELLGSPEGFQEAARAAGVGSGSLAGNIFNAGITGEPNIRGGAETSDMWSAYHQPGVSPASPAVTGGAGQPPALDTNTFGPGPVRGQNVMDNNEFPRTRRREEEP